MVRDNFLRCGFRYFGDRKGYFKPPELPAIHSKWIFSDVYPCTFIVLLTFIYCSQILYKFSHEGIVIIIKRIFLFYYLS